MKTKTRSSQDPLIRQIHEMPRRVFAVGDIHGCIDEAQRLIEYLKDRQGAGPDDLFVFIGDYIDRGQGSKEVVDLMLSLKAEWPKTVFLRGNHEDMLLNFLGFGGAGGEMYLANGGHAFFKSYGIDPLAPLSEIVSQLPPGHLQFFKTLDMGVCVGDFLLVHAGVSPHKSLEKQDPQDLLWIRREFIDAEHSLGKTVVFGHTSFSEVFLHLPYKIGIDTGVIYGNQLSVLELVNGDLFQVEVGEFVIKMSNINELLDSRSQ